MVDVSSAAVIDGKSGGSMPDPKEGKIVDKNSALALIGGDDSKILALDKAVEFRKSNDSMIEKILTPENDDLTVARALEGGASIDLARASVLADAGVSAAIERGDTEGALKMLSFKTQTKAKHLDLVAKRKAMELDNLTAHRQQIVVSTVNKLTEELSRVLKEKNIPKEKVDDILVALADASETFIEG